MTAVELTRAIERGDICNEEFHHSSHLRVAWVYLCESASVNEATEKMCATIKRFAAAAGKPEKFHETITTFWIWILAELRKSDDGDDIEWLLEANPWLLEKNLPLEYYSPDRLFSHEARTSWVEPDLKPLVHHAIAPGSSSSTRHPSHRLVSG